MALIHLFKNLKNSLSPHKTLIEIFIHKDNLLNNLTQYKSAYPRLFFAPVLKANAYGHGLAPVLESIQNQKLPFVCVDSHYEFRVVNDLMPKINTLILGFCPSDSIQKTAVKHCAFCIVSLEQLQEVSQRLKKPRKMHLKIDTGMHRQGVLSTEFSQVIKLFKANPNLIFEGICSHLADSDDEKETLKQINLWNSCVKYFKKQFPLIKYWHLSASGGVKYSSKIDANLVRLGIGFYGIGKAPNLNLKPALDLKSIITGIKLLDSGEKIGYGLTYQTKAKTLIATVPVGYFEGIDRRLSNQGYFKVGEKFCPVIGRLSMDISTINITRNEDAFFGQEVLVFSSNPQDKNSIENTAKICGTIPYEILVHIPAHLRRTVV